jgi:hypothetical protein
MTKWWLFPALIVIMCLLAFAIRQDLLADKNECKKPILTRGEATLHCSCEYPYVWMELYDVYGRTTDYAMCVNQYENGQKVDWPFIICEGYLLPEISHHD